MTNQEKFKQIDILTNCLQLIKKNSLKNEVAYLIHQIINNDVNDDIYDIIASYKIESKKEIFC